SRDMFHIIANIFLMILFHKKSNLEFEMLLNSCDIGLAGTKGISTFACFSFFSMIYDRTVLQRYHIYRVKGASQVYYSVSSNVKYNA
ncbi:hypothetical protein ACJX0J_010343, partial [Zea mays]